MMRFVNFRSGCAAFLQIRRSLHGALSKQVHNNRLPMYSRANPASYVPEFTPLKGPLPAPFPLLAAQQRLVQACFCTARETSNDHLEAPAISTDNDIMGEPEVLTPGGSEVVSFPLAQTGEGIAECELVQWACKEGDTVGEFDKLCVVQSDKASVEITSPYAGIIRQLHYKEGDIVKVGASLLDVEVPTDAGRQEPLVAGESGEEPTPPHMQAPAQTPPEAAATATAEAAVDAAPSVSDLGGNKANRATPAVRQLARELGIDLARTPLEGSGPEGRILAGDVFRAASVAHPPPPPHPLPASLPLPESMPSIIPVRGYRRAMIKSMTAATQIPVFHLHDEVCLDELIRVRRVLQGDPAMGTSKLTPLPFMLKALSTILSSPQHAILNSSIFLPDENRDGSRREGAGQGEQHQEAAIHVHSDHNIGVAMATSHGLVVPNIKQVQCKTIVQIAQELSRLQVPRYADPNAAVSLSDPQRSTPGQKMGTSSSSGRGTANEGMPSEQQVLCMERSQMQWRSSLGISWGADHRVVDGAGLASASNAWKAILEEPARLLLSLR
mmetsp:Transcript_29090/g.75245  ORF Transcript_29090/g.75245 Transcript_29090/m.75245 type:complete len:555 (-) Transcript_29090:635-2299(-)